MAALTLQYSAGRSSPSAPALCSAAYRTSLALARSSSKAFIPSLIKTLDRCSDLRFVVRMACSAKRLLGEIHERVRIGLVSGSLRGEGQSAVCQANVKDVPSDSAGAVDTEFCDWSEYLSSALRATG